MAISKKMHSMKAEGASRGGNEGASRVALVCTRIEAHIRTELSPKRLRHVLSVTEYAEFLADRFGESPSRARLAALGHDMAREWNPEEIREWAVSDGLPVSQLENEVPKILHGRAAAVIMKTRFHVCDAEVIRAVRSHTLGVEGMSPLEKILYCADYLEPGRSYIEREFRTYVEQLSLDEMVCACVEHNTNRGHEPAERTISMYRELCGREYPA